MKKSWCTFWELHCGPQIDDCVPRITQFFCIFLAEKVQFWDTCNSPTESKQCCDCLERVLVPDSASSWFPIWASWQAIDHESWNGSCAAVVGRLFVSPSSQVEMGQSIWWCQLFWCCQQKAAGRGSQLAWFHLFALDDKIVPQQCCFQPVHGFGV